ncbi:MAG: TRAP transporter large permease subunit, partial [Dehalobacterium sp.]
TDLFSGAILPGLLLSSLYIGYCLIRCQINPKMGPSLPEEERKMPKDQLLKELFMGVLPVAIIIFFTLGTILLGICTPTDAAAFGCFAAFCLTVGTRKISWKNFKLSVFSTVKITAMIMLLLAASNFFGAVFSRLGTANLISNFMLGLGLPSGIMLVLILMVVFVLAWPLEWIPIVVIYLPILLPVIKQCGWNMTWFCVLVAVCLQTAWLSPPVALSAYFLKGVVPEWDLKDIYLGMLQFMVLQIIGVIIVALFPQIVLWLPTLGK